jgi:hypothetical protein
MTENGQPTPSVRSNRNLYTSSTLPSKKPSVRKPLPDHLSLETVSRIADHPNTKIDELLPWKWTRAGSHAIAA